MVHEKRRKPVRRPWDDRFNQPTIEALRHGLPGQDRAIFDEARSELLSFDGCGERVVWHGLAWRWTIEYVHGRSVVPLAVIIPNPADLQIGVMVQPEFVRSVWNRRMKRALRDGLELAAEPFDTRWGVWSIGSQGLLDEVIDLIRDKQEFAAARSSK